MSEASPRRIQRKRTKGWRMPPQTIYVGRPAPMGNPVYAGLWRGYTAAEAVADYERWVNGDGGTASFGKPPTLAEICALRGFNLACWCKLCLRHDAEGGKPLDVTCAECEPCHVDPLGRIANGFACETFA